MDVIMLAVGFVAGFFTPIIILIVYGRRQIRKALKEFK